MCKKFLLAAVNAKYIHSNPGVYSLRAFAKERLPEAEIQIAEYTINHQMDWILQDIYRKKPDFVGFSCYIWNISQVYELVRDLKQVLPETEIWLGGPEVSYDSGRILSQEPEIRGIMRGEGELTFSQVAEAYLAAEDRLAAEDPEDRLLARLEGILGITYRDGSGEIRENGPQRLLSMDEIPFYYKDMAGFENRIVYYESSRGCPFSCSYCLSSIDKSVRFRSLSLVKKELDFFLERKVPQVKFVDRTFNCRREHTLGIWKHILDHDNGVTNFHFEVSADLFDQEELEMIGRMRPGLIQLEIGVQSTNPDTIREIRRKMDLTKLEAAVDRVHGYRNTHQHLDLIAGLPYEDYETFQKSFDEIYALKPEQLQLGFLKVLKGSFLFEHAKEYGIVYGSRPPYEVLKTAWLDYDAVLKIKQVEEMLEVYYNSRQYPMSIRLLETRFESAFAMFAALGTYYEKHGYFSMSHSRIRRLEILLAFAEKIDGECLDVLKEAAVYDIYSRENAKSRPAFAEDQTEYRELTHRFCKKGKLQHLERFYYIMPEEETVKELPERQKAPCYLLFDYEKRDALNHQAEIHPVDLKKEEA